MKKALSLLFLSSSIFSMNLDIVRFDDKSNDNSAHKMYIESKYIAPKPTSKVYIEPKSVFIPTDLGKVNLFHGKKGFSVYENDKKHTIQKCFTDKMVRDLSKEQLKAFLEVGYISINQMNNGEFSLKAKGRINGGGPLLGSAAYWVTKSLCYAVGITAVGVTTAGAVTAVVATGGALAPALAGTTAIAGTTVATAVGTTAAAAGTGAAFATTAGVVTVTAATGGLAAGTAAATAAAATGMASVAGGAAIGVAAVETTAAVVTGAGGIAATVAGIEAVSLAVGTFFGMMPTP